MQPKQQGKMFTTESVTAGHPDKLCDAISDAILDAALTQDPNARTAVETLATPGRITLAGEVTTTATLDTARIVRDTLTHIGYNPDQYVVDDLIASQSPDIAQGVDTGGAGDQGHMFGYAVDAPGYLPAPVTLAHRLARAIHANPFGLGPDGKTQVTFDGDQLRTVLVSVQHPSSLEQAEVREQVQQVIAPHVDLTGVTLLVNPTGRFVLGGPDADTGLTGRKIIVDTYGGTARHGGGAFSGKDPSKVDRSAAYAARQAALSLIANGYATECEVQLAYAIGIPEPVSIHVDTKGTGNNNAAEKALTKIDFTPTGITQRLNLRQPIYTQTAAYGHFGRPDFPWEQPLNL